jgi:hypothetical protein
MTNTDLRSKLAECENVIEQLVTKLQETADENDRLRTELANLTEGANAHQTLQSLYRNRDLPESLRAKAAAASLPCETPRLTSQPAPLELVAAEQPMPLAEVVRLQRARCDRLEREAREIRVLPNGQVLVLDKRNDGDGGDDTAAG